MFFVFYNFFVKHIIIYVPYSILGVIYTFLLGIFLMFSGKFGNILKIERCCAILIGAIFEIPKHSRMTAVKFCFEFSDTISHGC